jgi:transcriptional regulator with XRE-family HTH domain
MDFSTKLKHARKKKGLTQSEVAELMGVEQKTYSGYETGIRMPRLDKIPLLLAILDVSADDLFDWIDITESSSEKLKELFTKIQDLPEDLLIKLDEYIEFLQSRE